MKTRILNALLPFRSQATLEPPGELVPVSGFPDVKPDERSPQGGATSAEPTASDTEPADAGAAPSYTGEERRKIDRRIGRLATTIDTRHNTDRRKNSRINLKI